ncbi:hypothetical protein QJQ45_010689 [Haematococcus lacustris]|nr:hypothetical protein QJQ45_010689 [Haematococcus lacustris]
MSSAALIVLLCFLCDDEGLMKKSSAGDVNKGQQSQGLQGLPAELLDAVLRQLDASSRLPVFMTSKLLATALLRMCPRIRLTYPTQHDIIGQHLRELAPFLTEVLRNRHEPKLHLALQPASSLTEAIQQHQRAEPAAAASDASRMVAWTLGAVPQCGAVDCLTISWLKNLALPWEPDFSAALAASFPSLTSLTFQDGRIGLGHLAKAINHPLLSSLLHLGIAHVKITHKGELGRSLFVGSRLQELRLHVKQNDFLSGLVPLPPTLTQLDVTGWNDLVCMQEVKWDWVRTAAAVSSLTQLQQLTLLGVEYRELFALGPGRGPLPLLQKLAHLPRLHTLVLGECVVGQEQMRALLALTQITSLEVQGFSGLTSSQASADCSWRRLKVFELAWVTAAHLPLHSLTHPLQLFRLAVGIPQLNEVVEGTKNPSKEVLAAAEHNLCVSNKAGLETNVDMCLSLVTANQLAEQYHSHSRRTAQKPPHPSVAHSSSHSGPSTSLVSSSSPEGHITPGGPGNISGQGEQKGGPAAGGQALMQRLGRHVKELHITLQRRGKPAKGLSPANQRALAALFPKGKIYVW